MMNTQANPDDYGFLLLRYAFAADQIAGIKADLKFIEGRLADILNSDVWVDSVVLDGRVSALLDQRGAAVRALVRAECHRARIYDEMNRCEAT